jgi:hypothetical protein
MMNQEVFVHHSSFSIHHSEDAPLLIKPIVYVGFAVTDEKCLFNSQSSPKFALAPLPRNFPNSPLPFHPLSSILHLLFRLLLGHDIKNLVNLLAELA